MITDNRQRLMTVGELSRRTGVPIKTLRQYADWGMVYTVGRSATNYRLFDPDALWCLRWIGTLRGLGLTVSEIRQLAAAYLDDRCHPPTGPMVAERLRRSRVRLDARIGELQQMRDRIDDFETRDRAELSGQAENDLWADDPRACAVSA